MQNNTQINSFMNLPAEMRAFPNWLLWRLEDRGKAKPAKIPYSIHGGAANVTVPATWATFDEALYAYQNGGYDGIGFVFDNTPFIGIDIDGCYDEQGTLSEEANNAWCIAQSYTEFSQSGNGLHIIVKGSLPPGDRRNTKTGFEMYGHGSPRYFAMTGNVGEGTIPMPIIEDQAAIDEIHARFVTKPLMEPPVLTMPNNINSAAEQNAGVDSSNSDEEYLRTGLVRDSNFISLYNGERPHGNESSDDMALMNKLAYWCNANVELMKQAFFDSPHYTQKDTDHKQKCQRDDYMRSTIDTALSGLTSTSQADDIAWQQQHSTSVCSEGFEDGDITENTMFQPFTPFETKDTPVLPNFPTAALPDVLRNHSKAVAEDLQVAVDMSAVSKLGTIALCTQKKFKVEPKTGWREPSNLNITIIAPPSERKSSVLDKETNYVHRYVAEENERRRSKVNDYRMQCDLLKKRIESLKKAVADGKSQKNTPSPTIADIQNAVKELAELEANPIDYLTLITDDVTMEALATIMVANNESVGIVSAEGGIFNTLAGLYSKIPNLDLFLKAYSGDFFQSNRIGRKQESMQEPTLTALLMVQESVLTKIMGNDEFVGRGLLARFIFSIPNSTVGGRRYKTTPIPQAVESAYNDLLHRLLSIPYTGVAEIIRFTPEAQNVAEELFNDLEPRLKDGDLSMLGDWGGKQHGRTMRIAALLHIAEHIEQAANVLVAADTVERARTIGEYFIAHAIAAYQFAGTGEDKITQDARYILKHLLAIDADRISKRDLYQSCRSRFKKSESMQPGLDVLVERGYIAIRKEIASQNAQSLQKGGRPSDMVYINPSVSESEGASS